MLTPPSPPCPEVHRTDDQPGSDPDRAPRKEPELDFGDPERDFGPARGSVVCNSPCTPQMRQK
jgi:hypothetical protein